MSLNVGGRGGGRGFGRGSGNRGGNQGGGHVKGGGCPFFHGRHDRFCSYCGKVIEQQNLKKTGTCPPPHCGKDVLFRKGISQNNGYGKCTTCDAFIHVTHFFCAMCGGKHEEAFRRRSEQEKRRAQQELNDKIAENLLLEKKIKELEEEKKAKAAKRSSEEDGDDKLKKKKSDNVEDEMLDDVEFFKPFFDDKSGDGKEKSANGKENSEEDSGKIGE